MKDLSSSVTSAVFFWKGSAVPTKKKLKLGVSKELASDYFAQRREIGVLNIGDTGNITVDQTNFKLDNKDMLYIGRGSKNISCRQSANHRCDFLERLFHLAP